MNQAYLKERLRYDPATGVFTWIKSNRNGWIDKKAGWVDEDGYVYIRIGGRLRPAHRLAWLYMTGDWPPSGFIDHKNIVPGDDRWENLRDATKRINQENRRRAGKNNKCGLLGVSPNGKRWTAKITSKYIEYYLGTFDTPQEAHAVYVEAKRRLHVGCTL